MARERTPISRFRLKVLSAGGADSAARIVLLEADDAGAAQQQAAALGYIVLSSAAVSGLQGFLEVRAPRRPPVTLLCRELITLLRAGLNVVEGITALANRARAGSAGRAAVYKELAGALQSGQALSVALTKSRTPFPGILVASVRASELTGTLLPTLERYVTYAERVDTLRKRLVNAAIYPSLVLAVAALVMLFLMGYVVPRFSVIYEDMGSELSRSTRWMVAWGHLVHDHGLLLLAAAIGIVTAMIATLRNESWRAAVLRRLFRTRVLGSRMEQFQLARLYRTLAMLMEAGVALLPALTLTRGMASEVLVPRMDAAIRDIGEGQPVAEVLQRQGLLDAIGWRLLSVGERSGDMGGMFDNVADFYEDDLGTWLDWVTRVAEPLLMTATGLVIGIVVLLMYMPIFELAGSLQ